MVGNKAVVIKLDLITAYLVYYKTNYNNNPR